MFRTAQPTKLLAAATLFATFALGQASSSAPVQSPAAEANVRQARAVFDQTIAALGGAAYLNVRDRQEQGRAYGFYHGRPNSVGTVYWRFWQWPDKERLEFTKQRDVIIIHSGDQGFEITFRGVNAEDPEDLAKYLQRRNYSLEFVLRRWLPEPGAALFYEGKALAEDRPADQVTVINARNQAVTLYVDTETHLPIKKVYEVRDPHTGERDEEAEVYANYRSFQGINTPISVTRYHNGDMSSQRFLSSVTYNSALADSLFVPSQTPTPDKKHRKP